MQRKPLFWFLVSLLCLCGAVYFWHLGDKWQAEKRASNSPNAASSVAPATRPNASSASAQLASKNKTAQAASATNHFPYRLTNTKESLKQLIHNDKALLLMNASLDTSKPLDLAIPDRLRAAPNSGSYIVQAHGPLDASFRASLAAAGATFVSYIPNNAALVRVSDSGAQQLAAQMQSVTPWEPYYKLEPSLLQSAMEQPGGILPGGLTLVVFPDALQETMNDLKVLGADVVSQDRSPFGPVLTVHPAAGTLSALASLPGVEGVAPTHRRMPANDIMRVTLGVSADTVTANNYLGLTGNNVIVAIDDTGADNTHPDLTGRLFSDDPTNNFIDTVGHGTHVTGTILGNGTESFTVTNAQGSVTNASFRGMAPNAKGLILSLFDADPYLQQEAALTNCFISNNSWNYDTSEYDIAAASYDAAVRDALPGVTGSQPVLFVFSAGDDGGGATDGSGGISDTILSPATGKNVITVAATEEPRGITNTSVANGVTNAPFLPLTDFSDEATFFSARGNVGINTEGPFGRFKPDLIAPGSFVISCRSSNWNQAAYYNPTNISSTTFFNQSVQTNSILALPPLLIQPNAVLITITVTSNNFSGPNPFPSVPIYGALNTVPTLNGNDFLGTNTVSCPPALQLSQLSSIYFGIGNSTTNTVNFDVTITEYTTNINGDLVTLSNLNNSIAPFYRFESGTSMAAAGVSGMLALMQEYYQQRLHVTNSPALMKALLINGARSLDDYDLEVNTGLNSQGWGVPNLPNSVPPGLTNITAIDTGNVANLPIVFLDQNPSNALATGQSNTRNLTLTPDGANQDLRVTLVWTDPPGNPSAGVKLVNDLDLIVTNLDDPSNPIVYFGNDIAAGSIYNEFWDTNFPPNIDSVNNVENVFIQGPVGTNFTITVLGRRVNVNAVDANTNGIVQDYALVVSSGDGGAVPTPFVTFTDLNAAGPSSNSPSVTNFFVATNGMPLFNQRVGANAQFNWSPTNGTTNGTVAQWNFYVYTNTPSLTNANFTNVAILTFDSPNLGVVRLGAFDENGPSPDGFNTNATRYTGADIDLYVSTDPALTNLDTNAINAAFKSTGPTADEMVLLTNQPMGQVYYIGVKSEDQQAAQFELFAAATDQPFGGTDANGNPIVTIITQFPVPIPGGSASAPQHAEIIGVSTSQALIRKVTVTNTVQFPEFGDLIGTLTHSATGTPKSAVLNNHTFFTNVNDVQETFVYDDSGENIPGTRPTDPPGSLQNFTGLSAQGSWRFVMVNDSSLSDTGNEVVPFGITISPQPQTNGPFQEQILGDSWFYDFVDVPDTATNLTITVSGAAPPVDLFIKRGSFPTTISFDNMAVISGSGSLSITKFQSPPLNPGRYFFGIFNPNPTTENVTIFVEVDNSLTPISGLNFLSIGNEPIADDAVTYSTNAVGEDGEVVSAEVGVRIDHPRESDLSLTLISPSGTRVLLAENRGGLDTNGYGSGYNVTNAFAPFSSGVNTPTTNSIAITNSSGTLIINYQFFTVPDDMRVYYGSQRIFDSGLISGAGTFSIDFGPGSAGFLNIVMDEPGTNPNTNGTDQWNYSGEVITKAVSYTIFSDNTNLATMPIKFAVPPFGIGQPTLLGSNVFKSSFEGPITGQYVFVGDSFDGWTVQSEGPGGQVDPPTVLAVQQLALDGTNILALHGATISRTLTNLVPGDTYTLSYAYHGRPSLQQMPNPMSWWKGELGLTTVDTMGRNNLISIELYPPASQRGVVGDGIAFLGFGDRLNLGDPADLQLTNAITIEGWAKVFSSFQPIFMERGDNTLTHNAYHIGLDTSGNAVWYITDASGNITTATAQWPGVIGPNPSFAYVAGTYDRVTGKLNLYLNGALASSQPALNPPIGQYDTNNLPGVSVGNRGTFDTNKPSAGQEETLDEFAIYDQALSPAEIQDIYAAGSAGKRVPGDGVPSTGTIFVDGVVLTNISTVVDAWITNTVSFTATNDTMTLTIADDTKSDGTASDGILLDAISLGQGSQANGQNYYLPEESLAKLAGQDSKGTWLLEVLDNRLGATNPQPMLVSWQLHLVLADTVPFAFPLSSGVTVSNSVGPGGIAYYEIDVPPWVQFATNTMSASGGSGLNLLFNQNQEPTLTNGTVILTANNNTALTILNTVGNNAAPFESPPALEPGQRYFLGVQNPSTTATVNFTLSVNFDITSLTNAIPYISSINAGNVPRYFQFFVPTNSAVAVFQTATTNNGNLELVLRDGPPLPSESSFDYFSAVPGASNQTIIVSGNTSPVVLTNGTWYLGVFNNDSNLINYSITATAFGPPTIIPLTNGVPFSFNVNPGFEYTNFFLFQITNNPQSALFELYNLSSNADLYLGRDVFPYGPPFAGVSLNPGTNREQIVLDTNVLRTNINANWYLGVSNVTAVPVTYTIRAVEATTNGLLISAIPLTETLARSTNGTSITWPSVNGQLYEIQSSPSILGGWTNVTIVTAIGTSMTFTDTNTASIPGGLFYRIIQIP